MTDTKHTPYKAIKMDNSSFYVLTDTRTGQPVSYPTTRKAAKVEERFMNAEYEALAKAKGGAA